MIDKKTGCQEQRNFFHQGCMIVFREQGIRRQESQAKEKNNGYGAKGKKQGPPLFSAPLLCNQACGQVRKSGLIYDDFQETFFVARPIQLFFDEEELDSGFFRTGYRKQLDDSGAGPAFPELLRVISARRHVAWLNSVETIANRLRRNKYSETVVRSYP